MNPLLSSAWSRIRNLPFILQGDSPEKKLRLTLLIAGVASIVAGIFMATLNFSRGHHDIGCLYIASIALGGYIIIGAFSDRLERHLAIITHALLFTIIVLLLVDNHHAAGKRSEYNYLVALIVGSALVLRQQSFYLSKIFPLLCLLCYLFFVTTGLIWENNRFHLNIPQEAVFTVFNCAVPVTALLSTVFTYGGNYSATDLIKRELASAIERQQLELYYQPQVDGDKNLIGFEALLRWKHPEKGFISPEVFIPVAEKSGLIIDIGKWVLERMLQQIVEWDRVLRLPPMVFSINISPLQLMHRDFTHDTLLTLSHYKIRPERLKFEITETTFIYDQQRIGDVINHFSQLGIKWAIDDFGVGYSSLKSLSDFAIDDIKIDKSLIMHIFENESAAIVVQKTIELSRAMGLNVLAEGIESEEYFEHLRNKGCHLFQGYHFARPLPAAEALQWIKKAG
ncbi:diguanylate phosphodiesterase [Pantoea dispersa]|uniref:putative bifunctional diguanylate cyclase/phosphodiesterase n=1 Tax=Pantoea dispersa TaxID=59814 RepID=UPI0007374C9A|nr:EAL domain-containing protein [Pantoea dispersa]KTS17060.1 diguanylate phosphodiesterase [Pantoea dispersa]KTS88592.1 diguanylate phosphodiesterase [Pantoea dispersa]